MSFYQVYQQFMDYCPPDGETRKGGISIPSILEKERPGWRDFLALLSDDALPYLEEMARKAHLLTVQNFGRVIFLYTPLYLSNYCENECLYCSFSRKNPQPRRKLTMEEIKREAGAIASTGLRDILILTGESRRETPVDYLAGAVKVLKGRFSSLGIEVYPLRQEEYRRLISGGVDGLTIYQETYDRNLYRRLHPRGPKRDFRFRLEAPDRACRAEMRRVNIGALLGLGDWRRDAFFTGLHAHYLQKTYPEVEVSVSLPRLRPHLGGYSGECRIGEHRLVQIMVALRLFLPRCGINLSTRESARLRDNLLPLGVTRISAGSRTTIGGYLTERNGERHGDGDGAGAGKDDPGQFSISDQRSVEEIKRMLRKRGYQPVCTDWNYTFSLTHDTT